MGLALTRVDHVAFGLLWRHVGNLVAATANHDVGRLQVAMRDAFLMRSRDGVARYTSRMPPAPSGEAIS